MQMFIECSFNLWNKIQGDGTVDQNFDENVSSLNLQEKENLNFFV